MKNFNEFITEGIKYKDRSGKGFTIKGIDFVYTEQGGRFYGTSLYDVAKTSNVNKKSKHPIPYHPGFGISLLCVVRANSAICTSLLNCSCW